MNKNINIITDLDGRKVVLINDIRFKSRKLFDWNDIEKYLKEYIGNFYEILETCEKVYIGSDFPDEFTNSDDRIKTKGANLRAKANASAAIGELIQIATNKKTYPDYKKKHGARRNLAGTDMIPDLDCLFTTKLENLSDIIFFLQGCW